MRKYGFHTPTFYHSSNEIYYPGDVLRHGTKPKSSERLFEEIRRKHYPHRPSRLNSVFLFLPDENGTSYWANKNKYLYDVQIKSGKCFLTDGSIFTSVMGPNEEGYTDNDLKEDKEWVHLYWQGLSNVNEGDLPEILADGEVVVIDGPFISKLKTSC